MAVEPGFTAAGNFPRLSPDGTQIVYVRVDPSTLTGDIWVDDWSRRQSRRLTFDPGFDWTPLWSPDGTEVAFATNRHGPMDLYAKAAGGGAERLLFRSDKRKIPTDWSRDGKFLLFQQEEPVAGWDLWALPLDGTGQPFPVAGSQFNEVQAVFSPDGRWVAYTSDESGQEQIYVVPFRAPSATSSDSARRSELISAEGGSQPRWTGKELFYRSRDGKITVVPIDSDPPFVPGTATTLFDSTIMPQPSGVASYDVTRDGLRFVMRTRDADVPAVPYTLFVNWPSALVR